MTSDDFAVVRTGSVLTVTFNRPKQLNAFSWHGLQEAARIVDAAGLDPEVRVIVLTGAGRAFSSGFDLGDDTPRSIGAAVDAANEVTRAIRRAPKPVVAAVNGPAAGVAASFAFAADIVIAAESAYFLLAFANIGLMPDGGATALITAAVGRIRAMAMAMLPEKLGARTALEQGLVTTVVADPDFAAEVERVVTKLAAGPTGAYARIKQAINATTLTHLPAALETERELQAELIASGDYAEGVQAFLEKRPPVFTGR